MRRMRVTSLGLGISSISKQECWQSIRRYVWRIISTPSLGIINCSKIIGKALQQHPMSEKIYLSQRCLSETGRTTITAKVIFDPWFIIFPVPRRDIMLRDRPNITRAANQRSIKINVHAASFPILRSSTSPGGIGSRIPTHQGPSVR